MAGVEYRRSYVFDGDLELKDAGLIAADAAWQVGGSNKIINVGSAVFFGVAVIDVSAIEIASNDELYELIIQGSTSSTFASVITDLAVLPLGAKEVLVGDQDSVVGRFELPFFNVQHDTVYPFIRGRTDVTGSISTGINFKVFVGVPS